MMEKFKRKAATTTTTTIAKKRPVPTPPKGEATQSESDILDISSSEELEDVEPSEEVQPPTSIPLEPGSSQKKMTIIDWSLKPISVSDPRHPCQKKQLEMAKPSAPIKKFLLSWEITQKPGGSKDTPSAGGISSLIPSFWAICLCIPFMIAPRIGLKEINSHQSET